LEVVGHNIRSDLLLTNKPQYLLLGAWVGLQGGMVLFALKKHIGPAGSQTIKYLVSL
jgi:hypothetical protein